MSLGSELLALASKMRSIQPIFFQLKQHKIIAPPFWQGFTKGRLDQACTIPAAPAPHCQNVHQPPLFGSMSTHTGDATLSTMQSPCRDAFRLSQPNHPNIMHLHLCRWLSLRRQVFPTEVRFSHGGRLHPVDGCCMNLYDICHD